MKRVRAGGLIAALAMSLALLLALTGQTQAQTLPPGLGIFDPSALRECLDEAFTQLVENPSFGGGQYALAVADCVTGPVVVD